MMDRWSWVLPELEKNREEEDGSVKLSKALFRSEMKNFYRMCRKDVGRGF